MVFPNSTCPRYPDFSNIVMIETGISIIVKIADLLHEKILAVEKLNVSSLDLLLVKSGLGILSNIKVLKDDESGSSSLSIEFLHEDVVIGDVSVSIEELLDLILGDSVWESSHDEASLLVVVTNILGELDNITTSTVGWAIEVSVISI